MRGRGGGGVEGVEESSTWRRASRVRGIGKTDRTGGTGQTDDPQFLRLSFLWIAGTPRRRSHVWADGRNEKNVVPKNSLTFVLFSCRRFSAPYMCRKIRFDGKSEKFFKIFWELNKTLV